ncbi:MAG: hypothetical protein LBR50_03770 [Tannerella sp.]|jgi:hypothetical protein|nr:hypothetical protein [Tannerella sp.]
METKTKIRAKTFDTVKTFREIKEKISLELVGKSSREIKAYLQANSLRLQS